jgi:hypothetical protein
MGTTGTGASEVEREREREGRSGQRDFREREELGSCVIRGKVSLTGIGGSGGERERERRTTEKFQICTGREISERERSSCEIHLNFPLFSFLAA